MDNNERKEMPMKWHCFLIYFSLWAGAVLNVINAIRIFSANSSVYYWFPGFKGLDVIFCICSIALAVYLIYTRFQLAGLKYEAPKKLTRCYVFAIVLTLLYWIGASIVSGISLFTLANASDTGTIIGNIVMMCINKAYYNKREDMFIM